MQVTIFLRIIFAVQRFYAGGPNFAHGPYVAHPPCRPTSLLLHLANFQYMQPIKETLVAIALKWFLDLFQVALTLYGFLLARLARTLAILFTLTECFSKCIRQTGPALLTSG